MKRLLKYSVLTSILVVLSAIFHLSCKKHCDLGYKKQGFEIIYLPIPNPNTEKFIIQSKSEFESVFSKWNHVDSHNYDPNYSLPQIDFDQKTLLGAFVDYSSRQHFKSDLLLCFNKKKNQYVFEVHNRIFRKQLKRGYYPSMFWILTDKISTDSKIDIEIVKK